MKARDYSKPYRVTSGKDFRLEDINPRETRWVKTKEEAAELLQEGVEVLRDLQEKLYAQDSWALLVILQAMDAAGKDSTIKHVMSGVNPQGIEVSSLQAAFARGARPPLPLANAREASRPRTHRHLQPLVLRRDTGRARAPRISCGRKGPTAVHHEEYLDRTFRRHQRFRTILPHGTGSPFGSSSCMYRRRNRRRRFLSRHRRSIQELEVLDVGCAREGALGRLHARLRGHDSSHRDRACPLVRGSADHKWFTRLVVAAAIIEALEDMDLTYPELSAEKKRELAQARELLIAQAE